MSRRSLSMKQIREGMAYIREKLVEEHMSARDVSKDPTIPFSLTTYYKYLPKYEKQLQKIEAMSLGKKIDSEVLPPEFPIEQPTVVKSSMQVRKKEKEVDPLVVQNRELQQEVNTLSRFIVKKFLAQEMGEQNEDNNSNQGNT
jgi:hypothetical protein